MFTTQTERSGNTGTATQVNSAWVEPAALIGPKGEGIRASTEGAASCV